MEKESGFQIVTVSPRDKEFVQVWRHVEHTMEKRVRFYSFLWLKMMGKFS